MLYSIPLSCTYIGSVIYKNKQTHTTDHKATQSRSYNLCETLQKVHQNNEMHIYGIFISSTDFNLKW